MKTLVLTGAKNEIARSISLIEGDIQEVIVLVVEPHGSEAIAGETDIFAEMASHAANAPDVDDTRETIYGRLDSNGRQ